MRLSWQEKSVRTAVLVFGMVATLIPIVVLILDSFKVGPDFFSGSILPTRWTVGNYQTAFSGSTGAAGDLINSVTVAAVTTILSITLGTLCAFSISRLRFRWVAVITYGILAVRFYPKITTVLPYYLMMRSFGQLDTITAVVIAHVSITVPFVVLIMMAAFNELPSSLREAAQLDGCSLMHYFRLIALPLVRGSLATSAILTAMFSWNEFIIAASITSQRATTLPVLLSSFMTDKGTNLGAMCAVAVVVVVPIAVFILSTQRYLARGLTLGAVKE
ncbi:MAG: hypothetical protein JWN09_127 [Microbacteriaceae bacterium]|jgi:multiple sugar transport system permease protein|nr:hypothetical protein [Microbacteriaceae bacterium]